MNFPKLLVTMSHFSMSHIFSENTRAQMELTDVLLDEHSAADPAESLERSSSYVEALAESAGAEGRENVEPLSSK